MALRQFLFVRDLGRSQVTRGNLESEERPSTEAQTVKLSAIYQFGIANDLRIAVAEFQEIGVRFAGSGLLDSALIGQTKVASLAYA